MALWRDQATTPTATLQKEPFTYEGTNGTNGSARHEESPSPVRPVARVDRGELKESVIAADLTIEGKIEGAGHVRIAGRFKGDIQVEGNLTIEEGAQLAGEVRADTVIICGELKGNIQAANRVELQQSGSITGDLNAGSLTVAAGSRMRGRAEFGWDGSTATSFETNNGGGSAS